MPSLCCIIIIYTAAVAAAAAPAVDRLAMVLDLAVDHDLH